MISSKKPMVTQATTSTTSAKSTNMGAHFFEQSSDNFAFLTTKIHPKTIVANRNGLLTKNRLLNQRLLLNQNHKNDLASSHAKTLLDSKSINCFPLLNNNQGASSLLFSKINSKSSTNFDSNSILRISNANNNRLKNGALAMINGNNYNMNQRKKKTTTFNIFEQESFILPNNSNNNNKLSKIDHFSGDSDGNLKRLSSAKNMISKILNDEIENSNHENRDNHTNNNQQSCKATSIDENEEQNVS
jgi:hypothetical protein